MAAAGILAREIFRNAAETRRRKGSPLQFDDALTPADFRAIVQGAARQTPRVKHAEVVGMTIVLHVRSNTGLSVWRAEADFNDYGRLTGSYWLSSGNSESVIPRHFADLVQAEIHRRLRR